MPIVAGQLPDDISKVSAGALVDHPVPPRILAGQEIDAQKINLIEAGSSIEVVDRSCQYSRETEPKVNGQNVEAESSL